MPLWPYRRLIGGAGVIAFVLAMAAIAGVAGAEQQPPSDLTVYVLDGRAPLALTTNVPPAPGVQFEALHSWEVEPQRLAGAAAVAILTPCGLVPPLGADQQEALVAYLRQGNVLLLLTGDA